MKWIRGGTWVAEPVQEPSATAYKARLKPTIPNRERLPARVADSRFLSHPEEWARVIGGPASLEMYEPTPSDALLLLGEMHRISEKFMSELQGTPLVDWLPHRRSLVVANLLKVLATYGPLWPVTGVIDVEVGVPDGMDFRSVDLDAFAQEVHAFAAAFVAVEAGPRVEERHKLAEWMKKRSEKDLREVQVTVEVTTDYGVRFEARPVTLRAYLWEVLFGRNDRFPGICRYCGDEFPLRPGRGRPFRFCPDHRSQKYRTAVFEGRQPYKGNIMTVE